MVLALDATRRNRRDDRSSTLADTNGCPAKLGETEQWRAERRVVVRQGQLKALARFLR